jgi:prolipoprotein diacylglyceryl transferase
MILASIPSPPFNTIPVGPLDIHVYGLLIGIGVIAAIWITARRYSAAGFDADPIERILVRAVIFGFVGARLAYVSTHTARYAEEWWKVVAVWEGGLALFGGLTAGTLTAVWMMRKEGLDPRPLVDAAAVGIPVAQALGRWGNYFNQELFGTPTKLPWALEIDASRRPAAYVDAATFHPTFLYELLWNLAVVVPVLLWIDRRKVLPPGGLFLFYAVLYGAARFGLELIRTDTTFRVLGLSRNAWVALVVVVVGVVWLVRMVRRRKPLAAGP